MRCDHSDDTQTAALFERVAAEAGRLDINAESPQYVGRAVAAQVTDPALLTKSDRVFARNGMSHTRGGGDSPGTTDPLD